MAADNTLEILINLGFIGKDQADAAKAALAGVTDETKAASKSSGLLADASKSTSDATDAATQKFSASHREIRMLGNELGRVAGVSQTGMLLLGGVATAAWAAARAIGFLAKTWRDIQDAITGPIKIDIEIPPAAADNVAALAAAWNSFAEARANVIAAENTPQAIAGREAKKRPNELQLIKEAEKAMLEADAQRKYTEATNIAVASEADAAKKQKVLDQNAAGGEAARKEIKANLERLERLAHPGNAEYSGAGGFVQVNKDLWEFAKRYGYGGSIPEAIGLETTRLTQADTSITQAENYRKQEEERQKKKKKLLEEAGTESGQAEVLSREIADMKGTVGTPTGTSAAPGPAGPRPYNQTPEGMARHDFSMMEQYGEFKRQGGQLDQHQRDILNRMVSALVGHNATNREIKEALDEVLGTQRERDAIFQSFRRELQEIRNGIKTAH